MNEWMYGLIDIWMDESSTILNMRSRIDLILCICADFL